MIEPGDFVGVMPYYRIDMPYIGFTSAEGKFGFSWNVDISLCQGPICTEYTSRHYLDQASRS